MNVKRLTVVFMCYLWACASLAQADSHGARDASGTKEAFIARDESVGWQEIENAYDRASASWLQFFGEKVFIAARQNVRIAMDTMKQLGWLSKHTDVAISMLDARGDFAKNSDQRCTVQVNIDNRGSSPTISLPGDFGYSVTFVTAHELAHCRFDTLSPSEKYPDTGMLGSLGIPRALQKGFLYALLNPERSIGAEQLIDAYDEALADAAAAIVLRKSDGPARHFGAVLENAQSVRLGELSMAKRHGIPATLHQGGFVFDAVAHLKSKDLNWYHARRIAMQSVLTSTFYINKLPQWVRNLAKTNPLQVTALGHRWHGIAMALVKGRNLKRDEDRFLFVTGPTIFAIDDAHADPITPQEDESDAMKRWKAVAWQNSDLILIEDSDSAEGSANARESVQTFIENP